MEILKTNHFLSGALNKLKTQRLIFKIAYYVAVSLVFFIIFYAFRTGNGVRPTHEDDCIYFNSARLFYETGSLKAWGFIDSNVSLIGEYNWYGPGYGLLYGGISKIFSFHEGATIIAFHFLFLLFSFTPVQDVLN
ncbi:MAG: hypothetical protein ACK5B6_02835 [Bacteroidia bacterium]|jgi:hypothetical protein